MVITKNSNNGTQVWNILLDYFNHSSKMDRLGLPWWQSGEKSACQWKGRGFHPCIWEESTCHRAAEPMSHNYWACTLQRLKLVHLQPVLCNKKSHRNEKLSNTTRQQSPPFATRESPRATVKTQCNQELNKWITTWGADVWLKRHGRCGQLLRLLVVN